MRYDTQWNFAQNKIIRINNKWHEYQEKTFHVLEYKRLAILSHVVFVDDFLLC